MAHGKDAAWLEDILGHEQGEPEAGADFGNSLEPS